MRHSNTFPIGIDLGEHAVKVAQLVRTKDGLRVRDSRTEQVEIALGMPASERRDRWVSAVRRAMRRGAFRGRTAVCTLPLSAVKTRHIRVPEDAFDKAGEFILAELEGERRESGEELTICPIPVADLLHHGERKREYLCCVAGAGAIRELIETIEACGLVPEAIDLEPCAQVRPFTFGATDGSYLHVDVGRHRTRITAVRAGQPILMRASPVSSVEMLEELSSRMRIDLATALELAQDSEEDFKTVGHAITDILSVHLEALMQGIGDCVRYSGALFQGHSVPLVRLTGGLAALPGITDHLHRRLGMRTEVGDPFAALGETGKAGDESVERPLGAGTYSTALGLALRGAVA